MLAADLRSGPTPAPWSSTAAGTRPAPPATSRCARPWPPARRRARRGPAGRPRRPGRGRRAPAVELTGRGRSVLARPARPSTRAGSSARSPAGSSRSPPGTPRCWCSRTSSGPTGRPSTCSTTCARRWRTARSWWWSPAAATRPSLTTCARRSPPAARAGTAGPPPASMSGGSPARTCAGWCRAAGGDLPPAAEPLVAWLGDAAAGNPALVRAVAGGPEPAPTSSRACGPRSAPPRRARARRPLAPQQLPVRARRWRSPPVRWVPRSSSTTSPPRAPPAMLRGPLDEVVRARLLRAGPAPAVPLHARAGGTGPPGRRRGDQPAAPRLLAPGADLVGWAPTSGG